MRMQVLALAVLAVAQPLAAQDDAHWRAWQPEEASISLLDVATGTTAADAKDFEKYFYFHRVDTSFSEALTDIRECDARARGLWNPPESGADSWDGDRGAYGLTGAAAQAFIFGPAQERLARRATLRRCMFYKGYSRYGTAKTIWERFNYARDDGDLSEQQMQTMLAQQARLASGPRPQGRELGL